MSKDADDFTEWWAAVVSAKGDRRKAVDTAYQQLENAGLLPKVVVHRYLCAKGNCLLATVIRVGDVTLTRTKDYKLSPGLNRKQSVESARKKNTLDGDRHWPGHTYDVSELASWGDTVGIDLTCRHDVRTVRATTMLAASLQARPGHPSRPTLL